MAEKTADILKRLYESVLPQTGDIVRMLAAGEPADVQEIFSCADKVRSGHTGEAIFLRGIIAFSNHCRNTCRYCGLNIHNGSLTRYRLSQRQIIDAAKVIATEGIKTVVLQSGEDDSLDPVWLKELIQEIKSVDDMAVTLSVGERTRSTYRMWKDAGADRYLLKIETTDEALYRRLHPGMDIRRRIRCLRDLQDVGYQTGSGNIIGLPSQTPESIAGDILFFAQRNLDMIGIGPFIPHPFTPLAEESKGDVLLTLKAIALTRIITKNALMPATTALGSVSPEDARIKGLSAGANVLMFDFTPQPYHDLYELYPGRSRGDKTIPRYKDYLEYVCGSTGRIIDYARGDSFKMCEVL